MPCSRLSGRVSSWVPVSSSPACMQPGGRAACQSSPLGSLWWRAQSQGPRSPGDLWEPRSQTAVTALTRTCRVALGWGLRPSLAWEVPAACRSWPVTPTPPELDPTHALRGAGVQACASAERDAPVSSRALGRPGSAVFTVWPWPARPWAHAAFVPAPSRPCGPRRLLLCTAVPCWVRALRGTALPRGP